jgi:hypothetical protein
MHCPSAWRRIGGIIPDFQERAAKTNYFAVDIIIIHSIGKIFQWQVFGFDDKDGFGDLADSQGS